MLNRWLIRCVAYHVINSSKALSSLKCYKTGRRHIGSLTLNVDNNLLHRWHNIQGWKYAHGKNTHTPQPFYGPFQGLSGLAGTRRNLLDFMVHGKITEADTPTIRLGATPSGLNSDPPPSSLIFTPDALPAATVPRYHGLRQAANMLACIPSGKQLIKIIS